MTTGEGIALAVGGVVVVGGAVYFLTRAPTVAGRSGTTKPVPPQQAAAVGTAAIALGSGLGAALTSLFGPSKTAPTTATIQNVPQQPQPAAQSWNNTSSSTFDQLAAGDEAMGVEGPF